MQIGYQVINTVGVALVKIHMRQIIDLPINYNILLRCKKLNVVIVF